MKFSEFVSLWKSSRRRIFNYVFHLEKIQQGPLNTSFLFIKISMQNYYLAYLYKNNRNGSGRISPLSWKKAAWDTTKANG